MHLLVLIYDLVTYGFCQYIERRRNPVRVEGLNKVPYLTFLLESVFRFAARQDGDKNEYRTLGLARGPWRHHCQEDAAN